MNRIRRSARYVLVLVALVSLALHEPLWSLLVGVTLANLLVGDHFPFSHFPMYASLSPSTYYVYLEDEHGDPLATQRLGVTTTSLKKIYRAEVRSRHQGQAIERMSPELLAAAGQRTLAYVRRRAEADRSSRRFRTLRLRQVNLFLGPDGMRREVLPVAED